MIRPFELLWFVILEIGILLYISKTKDKTLLKLLVWQNLLSVLLLFFCHAYSFKYYLTFPDIFLDGAKYDYYAQSIAHNMRSGVFDLAAMESSTEISVAADLPYWTERTVSEMSPIHVVLGGTIYALLGYCPIIFKLMNIIFHAIATVYIYKFQINCNARHLYTKLFAFNPIFLFYSVSMLKESAIILLVTIVLYQVYAQGISFGKTGLALLALLLYRPYIAVILMLFIWLKATKPSYRAYVILLFSSVYLAIEYSVTLFSFLPDITEMSFAIRDNLGNKIVYQGAFELLKAVVSNPIRFAKYIVYYFYNAMFQPIPWVFSTLLGGEHELARYKESVNLNSFARWSYSFIHIYIIYSLLSRIKIIIRDPSYLLLGLLAMATIFVNSLKSGVERYQECVVLPLTIIAMMMIPRDSKRNSYLPVVMIFVYIFIFISDYAIRQRTIFNIGG